MKNCFLSALLIFGGSAAALSLGFRSLASRFKACFQTVFKLPAAQTGFPSAPQAGAPQAGFSLLGALAASAIGLVVVLGTTHSFVQQRISLMALEKRMARRGVNERHQDGWQMFMGKDWSCINTLKGKKLSGSSADAERSFEIAVIKDSAAPPAAVWDLSRNAAGKLTNSAAKEKLKSFGIDKVLKVEFAYEAAKPEDGQIVLSSKTVISGLMERKNQPAVWELSGIEVKALTAAEAAAEGSAEGAGDYVTACMFTANQKVCAGGAACAFHSNPGGARGGLVDSSATVAATAEIETEARASGSAQVSGRARIRHQARVSGNAKVSGDAVLMDSSIVSGNAKVSDNARIGGDARVLGNAQVKGAAKVYSTVRGNAQIFGDSKVDGNAKVYGDARVSDDARITGWALVYGNARIYSHAKVAGEAEIFDRAIVRGGAEVFGHAKVSGSAQVFGWAQVSGSAEISGNARILGSAKIGGNAKVLGNTKVCSGTYTSGTVSNQPGCSW